MIGDACTLVPVKDGKPSKLYTDLYAKTKKDRKLTNLLYALSQQEKIKGMFVPSELNSQGEPITNIFMEKLDVNSIISEKAKIESAAKDLGALDEDGDTVFFDDMDSITYRVLEFNNSHDKMRAVIKYGSEGFYIEVDSINAENFNANSSLRIRINILDSLNQLLSNAGLNTDFSQKSKVLMNPLNVYYTINQLKGLRGSTKNLNFTLASVIVDLFRENPILRRLEEQLGDDLSTAISQVSGYYVKEPIELTTRQETQISNFLDIVKRTMKRVIKTSEIDNIIEEAKESVGPSTGYAETDDLSVRQTLNELYKEYHIDQDSINILGRRVHKMSEAATQLLQIQVARLNEQRLKGNISINEKKLIKIQKDVDNGLFIKGIVSLLDTITTEIANSERALDRLMKNLKRNPNALEAINKISGEINKQLDVVAEFQDILKTLVNEDLLENDDFLSDSDLLDSIGEVSAELLSQVERMETNSRQKQVDVVKAFFRIYWGKEKKLPDGTVITIDDLMQIASKDINFFDRFLYAANTTNNEQMNLIAEAIKQAHERRDNILRGQLRRIRAATKRLHDSGSSFAFMFERDKNGYPTKIISDYDYAKFDQELEKYKEELKKDDSIDSSDYGDLIKIWKAKHSKTVEFEYKDSAGNDQTLKLSVPIYDAAVPVRSRLTDAQYRYYMDMMSMKAEMLSQIDAASNNELYDVIEIANDMTTALAETSGNPVKAYEMVKNKIVDMFKNREDDTSYGSILDANGMKQVHVNAKGEEIMTLPLFYTHKIKDRSRVSTDFSRSMIAYLASSQQYVQINNILDALILAKDYMLQKKVAKDSGGSILTDVHRLGKEAYSTIASTAGINTSLKGLADDFYERAVYGRLKKDEGSIWGIKVDKLADTITGYTSITGLSVNLLGAQANVLVGKIQMLIESGLGFGGEFFGVKDLVFADVKYWQMLPELLVEVASNNKSSMLGLLMEKFDVLDDFYDKLKESGFYKSPLSKILGNTSLFFLYGLGEHLLHAEGMLAVLHNKKNYVLDASGKEVPILEAFEVVKDDTGNGELRIKEGYRKKDGSAITEEDLRKLKRRIAYANKSMQGAFGTFEKGMIHKYAFGRLIMNFRQWMPAHYQRRFRGLHYDSDLEEYREGYYVSTWKFLSDLGSDLKRAKFQWAVRWRELSDMQRYNCKRALAETLILAMLAASIALLGDYKDKKGNWALRDLIYQLKRCLMETMASDPIALYGFVKNIITIMNSPVAAVKTMERISHLIKLTDLFVTIEDGKYKGENLYFHNLEKDLPFYGQLVKAFELGESDDLFKLFD